MRTALYINYSRAIFEISLFLPVICTANVTNEQHSDGLFVRKGDISYYYEPSGKI